MLDATRHGYISSNEKKDGVFLIGRTEKTCAKLMLLSLEPMKNGSAQALLAWRPVCTRFKDRQVKVEGALDQR